MIELLCVFMLFVGMALDFLVGYAPAKDMAANVVVWTIGAICIYMGLYGLIVGF